MEFTINGPHYFAGYEEMDDDMPLVPEKMVNLDDFNAALNDIANDIIQVQTLIDKEQRNKTLATHMQATFALSGLEIKMTNFAAAVRERFQ